MLRQLETKIKETIIIIKINNKNKNNKLIIKSVELNGDKRKILIKTILKYIILWVFLIFNILLINELKLL